MAMALVYNQLARGCSSLEPPISYLLYPFASSNPRYPHPRQRPVTLRSNSNPRRKHICRGERVLGIVKLRSQPRKRTYDRHGLCRDCIAATFRRIEVFVSRLFILSIDIAQTWSAIFIIRFLIVFCKLHNNISVSEVALCLRFTA